MSRLKLAILGLLLSLSTNAWAGGKECVATDEDSQRSVNFIVDWEPQGTTITFEQEIAWNSEALKFDVVYSGEVESLYLMVARSLEGTKPQLVELHFNSYRMESGILKAGDFDSVRSSLAKRRTYQIVCR